MLMPVFNTANFLDKALGSLEVQTFRNFEIVIVDDGSTDGSLDILKAFALRDRRVRLVSRENKGLVATRNELLEASRGRFVAWMDSDDVSLAHRLTRQYELLAGDNGIVCVGSFAECIDPDGNYLFLESFPESHVGIVHAQQQGGGMRFPTTMMKRDAALSVGGFREPFKMGEDFDFLLRLSELGSMANIQEPLYLYRQHVESVCATFGHQWIVYREQILELARERMAGGKDKLQRGEPVLIDTSQRKNDRNQISSVYLSWAAFGRASGNHKLMLRYLWKAVSQYPLSIDTWLSACRVLSGMT
ncbi:MAG: glycosyltransferase family A protein [Steroidobacteraceae bacterium]